MVSGTVAGMDRPIVAMGMAMATPAGPPTPKPIARGRAAGGKKWTVRTAAAAAIVRSPQPIASGPAGGSRRCAGPPAGPPLQANLLPPIGLAGRGGGGWGPYG